MNLPIPPPVSSNTSSAVPSFKDKILLSKVNINGEFRNLVITIEAATEKELKGLIDKIKEKGDAGFVALAQAYDIGGKKPESAKTITFVQNSSEERTIVAERASLSDPDKIDKEVYKYNVAKNEFEAVSVAGIDARIGKASERLKIVSQVFSNVLQAIFPAKSEAHQSFQLGSGAKSPALEPAQPPQVKETPQSTHPKFLQINNFIRRAGNNELRIIKRSGDYRVDIVPRQAIPSSRLAAFFARIASFFKRDKNQSQDFSRAVLIAMTSPEILAAGSRRGDSPELQEVYKAARDALASIQNEGVSNDDMSQIVRKLKDIAGSKASYDVGGKLYLEMTSRRMDLEQQTWKRDIAKLPDEPDEINEQLVRDWRRDWIPSLTHGDVISVPQPPVGTTPTAENIAPLLNGLTAYFGNPKLSIDISDLPPPGKTPEEEQVRISDMLTKLIENPSFQGTKLERMLRLSTQFLFTRGMQSLTNDLGLDLTWQLKPDPAERKKVDIKLLPDGNVVITTSTRFLGITPADDSANYSFVAQTTVKFHKDSVTVKPEDVTFSARELEFDIPPEADPNVQQYPAYVRAVLKPFLST